MGQRLRKDYVFEPWRGIMAHRPNQPHPRTQAMPNRLSRRRFLGEAAALSAAVTFAATLPADDPKKAPPSERLNLGIIGLGGQGDYNRRHVQHENIVALCDVDRDGKHVAE